MLCTKTIQNIIPSFLDISAGTVPQGHCQRRKKMQEMKFTFIEFYAASKHQAGSLKSIHHLMLPIVQCEVSPLYKRKN